MLNQITIISSLLFILGLAAIFQFRDIKRLRFGSIIVFIACIMNFTAFSNFYALSVEGQVISLLILLIMLMHLFIQKMIIND